MSNDAPEGFIQGVKYILVLGWYFLVWKHVTAAWNWVTNRASED